MEVGAVCTAGDVGCGVSVGGVDGPLVVFDFDGDGKEDNLIVIGVKDFFSFDGGDWGGVLTVGSVEEGAGDAGGVVVDGASDGAGGDVGVGVVGEESSLIEAFAGLCCISFERRVGLMSSAIGAVGYETCDMLGESDVVEDSEVSEIGIGCVIAEKGRVDCGVREGKGSDPLTGVMNPVIGVPLNIEACTAGEEGGGSSDA